VAAVGAAVVAVLWVVVAVPSVSVAVLAAGSGVVTDAVGAASPPALCTVAVTPEPSEAGAA
jgi:hypothetical protein